MHKPAQENTNKCWIEQIYVGLSCRFILSSALCGLLIRFSEYPMTTGKTVRQIYDSISCSTICWLFTMRCIFFYLSGCSFVWSYKTFQRINVVQPHEHHSSGLLKMKNFVSDFLIASRRHGACYDSILFSTVCWLLTTRYLF